MKRFFAFFLVALGLMLAGASCTREDLTEQDPNGQETPQGKLITISASLEQHATKTALGEDFSVCWSEGDKIMVFNSTVTEGEVFSIDPADAGQAEASFTGNELEGEGPFYAVYPASAATGISFSEWGDYVTVNFPAVQKYAENSFGPGANISVAKVDDLSDGLPFKNVGGMLSFTIKGDATVQSINVYTRSDAEQLNGEAQFWPEDEYPSFLWEDGQSGDSFRMLTLDCESGVALDQTGKTFYLAVPVPASELLFQKGFAVEVIDTDGNAMLKNSGKQEVERSYIRPMKAFDYSPLYKAAFLTSGAVAGAFSGVLAESVSCSAGCAYDEESGQYAFNNVSGTDGSRTIRIQDWTAGFSLSLTTPYVLKVGNDASVTVKAQGSTGVASSDGAVTMKVIKQIGNRVWLADPATGYGYIMMLVED